MGRERKIGDRKFTAQPHGSKPLRREPVALPDNAAVAGAQLLTREQVAALLGCSPWTIKAWVRDRKHSFPVPMNIPGLGHRWLLADIKKWQGRWLRQRRNVPRAEAADGEEPQRSAPGQQGA